jgi:hypothetical protein
MEYHAPEILDLGPVDELTFGGVIYPFRFDFVTGYVGRIQQPPPGAEPEGE